MASKFRTAQAIVFVFSLTDADSLNDIRDLHNSLLAHKGKSIPCILLGNKLDLCDGNQDNGECRRVVESQDGQRLAEELKFDGYFETSAKFPDPTELKKAIDVVFEATYQAALAEEQKEEEEMGPNLRPPEIPQVPFRIDPEKHKAKKDSKNGKCKC